MESFSALALIMAVLYKCSDVEAEEMLANHGIDRKGF